MTNDFILILDKKDDERFRQFKTGYYQKFIKSIEKLHGASNLWAFSSIRSDPSLIQKNDRIFFASYKSPFSHYGIVSKTFTDQSIVLKMWGDSPRTRSFDTLVLFSSVNEIDEPFNELCRKAGLNPTKITSNIYIVKNKLVEFQPQSQNQKVLGIIISSDDGQPDKKSEVVRRFIRDTKKVRQLKRKYNDKCQICGYAIMTSVKSRYSEVHHLHPLKDGGDDDFENMLVLCPTHHVEFDYKVIGIEGDKNGIIDKNGKKIGSITMAKGHVLNEKNIKFHLAGMNE